MKINSIVLSGFRSHVKTKMTGLSKVVILVGPNGAGKSSLLDAIAYALTGVTRGVDDGGKGADALACQLEGMPKMSTSVLLDTDKGEILRGLGQGPKSQAHIKIVSKLGMDDKVLRVLAAPMNLLRLPTKKQEEVFLSLTGSSITPEAIGKVLTEAGIDLEKTPVDLDELCSLNGREAKLSYWKQLRVDMKRKIQTLVFTPSDQELPEADEIKRRGLEKEVHDLSQRVAREKGAGETADQSLQHFEELIGKAEDRLKELKKPSAPAPTLKESKGYRAKIDECQSWKEERVKKAEQFTAASKRKSTLEQESERVKALGRECTSCGQEITKSATEKKLESMRTEFKELSKTCSSLSGEIKKLEEQIASVDVNDLLTRINAYERAADEAKRKSGDITRVEQEISDLRDRRDGVTTSDKTDWSKEEARIDEIDNQIELLKAAEIEAGRQLSVNTQRSEIEENLELMEKMLKAVGPGGPIQQLMASSGTEDMVKIVRGIGEKLGVGDIGIKFGPWQITLNGRDIELASASEEFRVAAAFGIAFAEKAGASIVCLDGAEILRGDNRGLFQDLLFSCGLEQIFVAFASDSVPESYEGTDGLSMFSVVKGDDGASVIRPIAMEVAA